VLNDAQLPGSLPDELRTDFSFHLTTEPLTNLSFRASTAFHPDNMLPSSSSASPPVDILNTQSLRPLSLEPVQAELPGVDKFVAESPRLVPLGAAGQERPRHDSPPLPLQAAGHGAATEWGTQVRHASSGEEYASAEMDSGSNILSDSLQEGRSRHAEA